jgi:hypothetical protein
MYIVYRSVPQTKIFSCLVMTPNELSNSYLTNASSPKVVNASVPSVIVQKSDDSCLYSLAESDGWFCEYDTDWKRRKRVHQFQDKRNRNDESLSGFFEKNWEPTLHCAFEQRFGNAGEGGKWVCDIDNIEKHNYIPLIYSLGSNGDFSFERALKKVLPPAEIHTFDTGNYTCPAGICKFHQTTVGDTTIGGTKSLKAIIEELGHTQRRIDILKVDIEGNEYMLFEEYFQPSQDTNSNSNNKPNEKKLPYIRQILIEIHLINGAGDESAGRAHALFELLRSNNYAIFHKEIHSVDSNGTSEYGFIRLNRVFFHSRQRGQNNSFV